MANINFDSALEGLQKTFEEDIQDRLWNGFSDSIVKALDRDLEKKIEEEKKMLKRSERMDMNNVSQLERWIQWQEEEVEDEESKPIDEFIHELEKELKINKDIEELDKEDSKGDRFKSDAEFETVFNEKLKLLVDKFKQTCQELDPRLIVEDKNEQNEDEESK